MKELFGHWCDSAIHGGHSCWSYSFKSDGTGFSEFTNFTLCNYAPIRWSVDGDRLEIISDSEFSSDDWEKPLAYSYRAVFPFKIEVRELGGKHLRVLILDIANADAPEFTKRYAPEIYGFIAHIDVGPYYRPDLFGG